MNCYDRFYELCMAKYCKYAKAKFMFSVYLGKHIETKKKAAIKIIKPEIMENIDMGQIEKEVDVLKTLDHDNITRLLDAGYADLKVRSKTSEVYHIALEVAKGGELFDFISVTGEFSEDECRYYFHQLVDGMEYLHSVGYSHRDLKTENILLDKHYNLVIADFGYASGKDKNTTAVGTEDYMAPEILRGDDYQGKVVDIFGMGLILFMMRARGKAFMSARPSDDYYRNFCVNKPYKFWSMQSSSKEDGENHFSEEFKDLVNLLFANNPTHRLTFSEIKKHPWYNGALPTQDEIETSFAERKQILSEQLESQASEEAAHHEYDPEIFEGRVHRGIELDAEDSQVLERQEMEYDSDFKRYTEFFSTSSLEELWNCLATYVNDLTKDISFAEEEYGVIAKVSKIEGKHSFANLSILSYI